MTMFRAALFAIAVLGVNGAPFVELKARQNDTANTTSSETEGHWTIFSPQTAKPQESLDIPGVPTTYSPVPSPVTAITQLSIGLPKPDETESTTQDSESQTRQPKPIIQPTGISLIVPVTDTVSDKTSFITVVPTVRIGNSATYIFVPGTDTTSPSRIPKVPHTENPGSELQPPSEPTEHPNTHTGDDDWDHETTGPDATTNQPTQAGAIIASETSNADSEDSTGSQTQDAPAGQRSSTTGTPQDNEEAHASPTFVVDNTPLVAGGSPITVSGTTYSLASTGAAVAVNGNTVSITTDDQGRAVPASIGSTATSQALGGVSIVPADATTTGDAAQETGSQQSSGGPSGTQGATSTSSTTSGGTGATTTSAGSEPAVQSDNSGASRSPTWPIAAVVGAVGLLAVAV